MNQSMSDSATEFSSDELSGSTFSLGDLDKVNIETVDIMHFTGRKIKEFRVQCAFIASYMETMTMNILLFVLAVLMEVTCYSIWIFGLVKEAAFLQLAVSMVFLTFFITKVGLSMCAYGRRYLKSQVFLLEAMLLIMDGFTFYSAFIFLYDGHTRTKAVAYFVLFGGYIFFHAIRIFHIFYATARPPAQYTDKNSHDSSPSNNNNEDGQLESLTGIWVSRTYEGMKFASSDLVSSISSTDEAPPANCQLQLFATRDKPDQVTTPFAAGSAHSLHAGCRPDWNKILKDAVHRVHCSPTSIDQSAGVFFCGSPAIARTLQHTAIQVTARHQRRYHCNCRVLVQKENF